MKDTNFKDHAGGLARSGAGSWVVAIVGMALLTVASACGEVEEESEHTDADCDAVGSQSIFEDDFDGDSLDEATWNVDIEDEAICTLTGEGELQVGGQGEGGEATLLITSPDPGGCYTITTEFRTTMNDPYEDNVDMALLLNFRPNSDDGYALLLTSDPIDGTRDYAMSIYLLNDGEEIELVTEFVGGTTPQITCEDSYTLAGTYCNGCISFTASDSDGDFSKTITTNDSTHESGLVGFAGDMNASTGDGSDGDSDSDSDDDSAESPAIYFDYFSVVN